jgi:GTP pyrophosphokinase
MDNTLLNAYSASRSNALMSFLKSKITRKTHINTDELEKDEITSKYDSVVFNKEEEKLDYKLATCCHPIPGDDVFGFLTVSDGLKVHKMNCPNALSLQSNYAYRIMPAKWIDSSQQEFLAHIKLTGIDHIGLVNDITTIISENMSVNMKSISFKSDDGLFLGKIDVVVKNKTLLKKLLDRLSKINGIDKVTRE